LFAADLGYPVRGATDHDCVGTDQRNEFGARMAKRPMELGGGSDE
jgi:hypothetical protein